VSLASWSYVRLSNYQALGWALLVAMEATISEPTLVGARSASEAPELRSQGSSLLLARFSGTYRYLSLRYKYGNTLDIFVKLT